MNGDGFSDCAFSNNNGATVTVVLGSRNGLGASESVATTPAPHALALADLNRDGRADLIVTSEQSDELLIFFATAGR